MKKWQKKAIKEIMEEFDFDKVHKVMLILDWKWGYEPKTPTVDQLRATAEELLTKSTIGDINPHYVSTGGFEAVCDTAQKGMRLLFVVSDWEAFK
jgi:hypothetical protein